MTGKEVLEKIAEAREELDKLNYGIAEYRVDLGMSDNLRDLYRVMGKLDDALIFAEGKADLSSYLARLPDFQDWNSPASIPSKEAPK